MQHLNYSLTIPTFSYFTKTLKHFTHWQIPNQSGFLPTHSHWASGKTKTQNIHFFLQRNTLKNYSLPKLHIANQVVPYTTTIQYLGVYLDFELSFKEHINKIYEKVNKYVGIFNHVRHKLPPKCRRVLYFSFVSSYIYYCAEIYGNVSNARLKPLQLVQSRMLRALHYKDEYFPINQMHKSYGILKIQDIGKYEESKIIHSLLIKDKKFQPY